MAETAAPVVILNPVLALVARMPRGTEYGCGTDTPVPVPATVGMLTIDWGF